MNFVGIGQQLNSYYDLGCISPEGVIVSGSQLYDCIVIKLTHM